MKCLVCDAEDSNTELSIKLEDGKKVLVYLCDEHVETITIKEAKELYNTKQDKVKELLEHAKKLGLSITINEQDNKNNSPIKPSLEQINKEEKKIKNNDISNKKIISTKELGRFSKTNSRISVNGEVPAAGSEYNLSSLKDKLSEEDLDGTAEIAVVEGREGQQLVLPQKRIDKTGTTIITIKKSENDRSLQDRFKRLAESSMRGEAPDLVHNGYDTMSRKCPVCRGNCVIKLKGEDQPCPKCNGSGLISIY